MSASNTRECVLDLRGLKVVGFIEGLLPRGDRDIASHCKTILFDDGTGFTWSENGSFWRESKEHVTSAINELQADLERTRLQQADLIVASGARTA